ncbi:MAG TPA: DNA ligase D, partial [Gaiellaceae bacterium]|nr:DNA ligase D [Gaiellaceae bacterium]
MSLDDYRRKRDPKQTPEPFGGRKRGKQPIFVIQRHDARRLHYDFRLERDGVLLSWAVPKGVPLEPGARALAVHVEDHPLEYAKFHGEIPAGQYGAGTVEIWDNGTYELLEEKRNGQLKVRLHGKRLEGAWTLVPAHMDGKKENWLLIKSHDESGGEIAQGTYSPMLATLATDLPGGDGWVYEVKFDGFRAIAYVRGGECELVSRNGNRLNDRFPEVAKAIVKAVKTPNAVLDGEITRIDPSGKSSFSELQQGSGPLVYFAFDLLEVDGEPLVDLPLLERKERLQALLDKRVTSVSYSDGFDDGEALLHVAREQHLEGIIAKRKDCPYKQKRTRDWLKIKTDSNDEFVVAGYTRGSGRRANTFGSLVLAANEDGQLRYVGNVGTGFNDAEIRRLLKLLRPLETESCPFSEVPKMPKVRKGDVQWVEPKLVAQVRYGEFTHDGHLRHPAYLGLRDDKAPEEVTKPPDPRLKLTNLDKPFWPDEGISKGDLLAYYEAIAPVLVPHLRDRPFTMRRYPDGAYGKAFFQKDAPKHMPDWIPTFHALVSTRDKARTKKWIDWPLVNEPAAVLWMVNMGCIDMNTWYSRVDKPERPDFVLFDLDPTPEVPWTQTVEVALILKELLDQLGLASFPKTSGGKGFHILVPIERRATYEDTRQFAE